MIWYVFFLCYFKETPHFCVVFLMQFTKSSSSVKTEKKIPVVLMAIGKSSPVCLAHQSKFPSCTLNKDDKRFIVKQNIFLLLILG